MAFDGVLGFSNGAAAAAMLMAREPPPLRFALFAGGYLPTALLDHLPIAIPSLHMMGSADELVPVEDSLRLQGLFDRPRQVLHEQGHIVPQRSAQMAEILSFLRDQIGAVRLSV